VKKELVISLKTRIKSEIAPQNPVCFIKVLDVEAYIDSVISIVYLYTRAKKGLYKDVIFMSEVIAALGHKVMSIAGVKKHSGTAAKTGAFILYSFEELGLIELYLGKGKKHASYCIRVVDDEGLLELWASIPLNVISKLPSTKPYAPWRDIKHDTGKYIIKTHSAKALGAVNPLTTPILFESVNRAQSVGWLINRDIYELQLWALRNKTDAFSDIWEQRNPEARATKLREARAVSSMAEKFLNAPFYHLYYYDFRGRRYPATAYLHEQGSDLARGMLLRSDSKAIGEQGFFWLLVSIASNWGGDSGREDGLKTDKLPLMDRYKWVLDNEEIILSYAESPKVHQGWMNADKPWQFMSGCLELFKVRLHQQEKNDYSDYSYVSHLECFIDGSNNGCQHLAALAQDEDTAPHVNLIPSDTPGDLYDYVARDLWKHIEKDVAKLTSTELADCEKFIDDLIEMKKKIHNAEPKSEYRKRLGNEIREFKYKNHLLLEIASPIFWDRIKDHKERRKIIKRNVMTLPYGGTAYGLGRQIIDDSKKHGIDQLLYLEHKWGSYLGRAVFDGCKETLARLMQLLRVFENAGKSAEARGEFLSWTVPITKFLVVQNYTQGTIKKIWVQYGPPSGERNRTGYYQNTLQLNVCFIEDKKPSRLKQSQGASPNVIHSLDAAHLALIVCRADFPVTTVHDSFGCLLADMPELFKLTRRTFVELYKADPLMRIMKDIRGDTSAIKLGNLDISLVLDSEFCFC
jgi:DNA-directed RNA polymerase